MSAPEVDFGGAGAEQEPLPIDRAGELWRAAALPGSNIVRRSAMRRAVSSYNSAVIEATLLLGQAIFAGTFTGPKADMLRGAYTGFQKLKEGRRDRDDWMSQMLTRDLRDAILVHYLDRVDQLLHELRMREKQEIEQPAARAEHQAEDNDTYGMF